jgi:hypothetical protein
MSELPELPASRLSAALVGLRAAVTQLAAAAEAGAGGQLWTVDGRQLLDAVAELHRLGCVQDAALHGLVREVDADR